MQDKAKPYRMRLCIYPAKDQTQDKRNKELIRIDMIQGENQ
jgi:hypothetical protein